MRFLEKFNHNIIWLLSILVLIIFTLIPASPFQPFYLLPVILCFIFETLNFEIVFAFTIINGLFFSMNFFSIHQFGPSINDPMEIIFNGSLPIVFNKITQGLLNLYSLIVYFLIFYSLFFLNKKIFKRLNFSSSNFLSIAILSIILTANKSLKLSNEFTIVINLTILILARHAFYIYNYINYYKVAPRSIKELFLVVQPFWFLNFEITENPKPTVQSSQSERSKNFFIAANILLSSLAFKLFLILYLSLFNFIVTQKKGIILNDGVYITETIFPILKNWKNESALKLLFSIVTFSIDYLGTTFFVYSRIMIAIARMCGFSLPDHINRPWKSKSFADFFSRTMYYYNIIIINLFFYPALEFSKKFSFLTKKLRIFLSLNWALIFGGFIIRFLKDIWMVYKLGFEQCFYRSIETTLPYLVALSLAVSISLYFEKKSTSDRFRPLKLLGYLVLYSFIASLNFSRLFGSPQEIINFYLKTITLGLY